MADILSLIDAWRDMGPVAWGGHQFGWLDEGGRPIVLEPWQGAALAAWWERRDVTSTLALSNIKKTGKTTCNAVLTCWRWLTLPAEHFAANNDLDQSTARQFGMVSDMVRRHPILKRHVKAAKSEMLFEPTGSKLTALSVDAAGNAGANHLTASHTEAWGILHEGGIRSWEELTPPPGTRHGLPALRLADSYAGWQNESDTWHNLVDRGLRGERVSDEWPIFQADGLLLFHLAGEEAQELCFRGTPGQRDTYYRAQAAELRPGTFARLHRNERASSEDSFISPEAWAALVQPGYFCPSPSKDVRLYAGLDLAVKHDYAGFVSVYVGEDGRTYLGPYKLWKPRPHVDLQEVEDYILRLAGGYNLGAVAYDPYQAQHVAQRLSKKGVRMLEYAQTPANMGTATGTLLDLINQGRLVIYVGSSELREHVLSARIKETAGRGARLVKGRQASRKIDLAVSLAMACSQAQQPRGVLFSGVSEAARRERVDVLSQQRDFSKRWRSGLI